ncbi:hypothetical protein BDY17DRAFT_257805 [Neohortaea acidophila]|uniref:SET domain-containing protein n=1 Tax=Neohortaea acidophila TaxID=245834 RepID=A0A6A6PG30_9PEZI|nr:uncharacterized protein BDY17DRAFT_257805 [Neohortaea acidophila]KAF2478948.1 hypothetical protein BDY17DRAFT_257805 [Neohortaea acidophila]
MAASPTELAALEQWFRANHGHLHPGIHLQHDDIFGVHYRTRATIEAGVCVASASHAVALSYLNALVDEHFPVFQQQRHRFPVAAAGFFYLMSQWVNREISFWKAYLDTLPTPEADFSQPLFFEQAADTAWLEGTDVWHTVRAREEVYRNYFDDGIAILRQEGIDVQPYTCDLWTTYKSTLDGRREAVLLDMSAVPREDLEFPVLFPGLDAANHNPRTKVDWVFDVAQFSVIVAETIEAGAEVCNNYGPKGNGELLIGYGFCIPDNPHDTVALTLKAPPRELQLQIQQARPAYLNACGDWNSEKATFRLGRPRCELSHASHLFSELPEALLELLVYILRHERGLPFHAIDEPRQYLDSEGRRYLPHIARMIVQSLNATAVRLQSAKLPSEPQNCKQQQAAIYRQGQVDIINALINTLKTYTRSLLWQPSPNQSMPTHPCLIRLQDFIDASKSSGTLDDAFLTGIGASANTTDLTELRLAEWEEDVWVLALCYSHLGSHRVDNSRSEPIDDSTGHEPGQAGDLMDIVDTAASVCPDSIWANERWSASYIASIGGRILQHDSFMIMCPKPGHEEVAEPTLCVYLDSWPGG